MSSLLSGLFCPFMDWFCLLTVSLLIIWSGLSLMMYYFLFSSCPPFTRSRVEYYFPPRCFVYSCLALMTAFCVVTLALEWDDGGG